MSPRLEAAQQGQDRERGKKRVLICCKEMLEAINEGHLKLDAILWLHLHSTSSGPSIKFCPFCGDRMPFENWAE